MKKRRKRTNDNVPAKGRVRDIADRLWSRSVRNDWDNKCAVCGRGKCDAHHLIPRQHYGTRYNIWNGIALCSTHHQFDPDIAPHQNAAGWLEWLHDNHFERWEWYADNLRPEFNETKTALYFCGVIMELRQYVDPELFEEIVGIKFSAYLIECEKPGR